MPIHKVGSQIQILRIIPLIFCVLLLVSCSSIPNTSKDISEPSETLESSHIKVQQNTFYSDMPISPETDENDFQETESSKTSDALIEIIEIKEESSDAKDFFSEPIEQASEKNIPSIVPVEDEATLLGIDNHIEAKPVQTSNQSVIPVIADIPQQRSPVPKVDTKGNPPRIAEWTNPHLKFSIPDALEIQDETYKETSNTFFEEFYADENTDSQEIELRIILQQRGLNLLEPVAIKQYCRIIIETSKANPPMSNSEFALGAEMATSEDIEEINSFFEQLANSVESILHWNKMDIKQIGGLTGFHANYERRGKNGEGPVTVDAYMIPDGYQHHTVILSYRTSEHSLWENAFQNFFDSLNFTSAATIEVNSHKKISEPIVTTQLPTSPHNIVQNIQESNTSKTMDHNPIKLDNGQTLEQNFKTQWKKMKISGMIFSIIGLFGVTLLFRAKLQVRWNLILVFLLLLFEIIVLYVSYDFFSNPALVMGIMVGVNVFCMSRYNQSQGKSMQKADCGQKVSSEIKTPQITDGKIEETKVGEQDEATLVTTQLEEESSTEEIEEEPVIAEQEELSVKNPIVDSTSFHFPLNNFVMISKNITNIYLYLKGIQGQQFSQLNLLYLALAINAQGYIQQHQIHPSDIMDICQQTIAHSKDDNDEIDLLHSAICDIMVMYFGWDTNVDLPTIFEIVQQKDKVIIDTIIKTYKKNRPGIYAKVSVNGFPNSPSRNIIMEQLL